MINKMTVLICQGSACVSAGAIKVTEAIKSEIAKLRLNNVEVKGTKCEHDNTEVKITGCHGFCQRGPTVIIQPDDIFYTEVKPEDAYDIVHSHILNGKPVERLFYRDPVTLNLVPKYYDVDFFKKQQRSVILTNCGFINPEDIDDYLAVDGYKALKKALLEMDPEEVIDEIKKSGLRGRGGAGFPTGVKWEFCRKAPGDEKYMICNADEGDPGAFMDRGILEADPHKVIEGLTIAGYAIGASVGYIYVRAEYPLAIQRIRIALQQAKDRGFLGQNILGTDFSFNINVMEGAGAFVCGEETALIASIEGRTGRPRMRPPFPAQSGLYGKPTTINNVKTLASVPMIIYKGADWYSSIGTERSKGTTVFALTGHVANSGLAEVALGTTLREIIYEIGGGIPDGKRLKAVQTGGPSGGCLPAKFLDSPVDYESLAATGSIMGSGGMVVMNEDSCIVDIARYFVDFTQRESCGKCVPCRVGTRKMLNILKKITSGKGKLEDIDLLEQTAKIVKNSALCGLGQTAPNPILTTIRYFRDEYEEHIKHNTCSAVVCKEIVSSPCQHTCPIDTEATVYIALIAHRRFAEAWEMIRKDNPLPSICGRACYHFCESKCQAGKWGEPIAVRTLKRFVADYARNAGIYEIDENNVIDKEKVAIVGSGPAGLTAGYFLAKKGYDVTIFEALDEIGGAMRTYVPEYRLPRDILDLDINNIKRAGVKFKTGVRVGKDISINELRETHRAVFIAAGANKPKRLGIPNEDAEGVLDALEFLRRVNLKQKLTVGKRVGIIGGGNAAVDVARVMKRVGNCDKITIIYRRTRREMPALEEEVNGAIEEGIEFQFLSAPKKILVQDGKVVGLECIRTKLGPVDESGRRSPVPIENSEFVIELDNLVIAIGEGPDPQCLGDDHCIEFTKTEAIAVDRDTLATNVEGVFAGGDIVTHPQTIIEAIQAGKIAANMIDKYIRGEKLYREYNVTRPSRYIEPLELTDEEIRNAKRVQVPYLPVEEREGNFREVELTITEEMAVREARRCLRCDLNTEDGKRWLNRIR